MPERKKGGESARKRKGGESARKKKGGESAKEERNEAKDGHERLSAVALVCKFSRENPASCLTRLKLSSGVVFVIYVDVVGAFRIAT